MTRGGGVVEAGNVAAYDCIPGPGHFSSIFSRMCRGRRRDSTPIRPSDTLFAVMQVRPHNGQSGFSLLEMLFATVILLVGLVAVAQLVPVAVMLDHQNILNSSATVLAQDEMDQFLGQPLTSPAFVDTKGNACSLGDPTQPNIVVGSQFTNGFIDFNQPAVPGYSLLLQPDANGPNYDLRWAVITISNGSVAYSKRFILRVRQQGGNTYFPPVTLDAMISK